MPSASAPTAGRASALPALAVGHTPLVELTDERAAAVGSRVFAKLESVNPGGSLKDRPVSRMLSRAVARGVLRPGDPDGPRLLDSSSGNAGIAYAMFGAALGVPVTLVVPGNASAERLARIRAHGAELVLTDPQDGYDHALREARRLAADHPDRYWHCDQYGNDENWRAHFEGTGSELLAQCVQRAGRPPDVFVCGVGTGGSLTGIGRRLRRAHPGVRLSVVVPDVFPGIEGLKPLGSPDDIVPDILDEGLIDERVDVRIEEAVDACHRLARRGLFVGPSAGAYAHVAGTIAAEHPGAVVTTLLCDTGERYLSTGMWEGLDAPR